MEEIKMAIKIEYICDRCKEKISEEEEFLCYFEKKYYHWCFNSVYYCSDNT